MVRKYKPNGSKRRFISYQRRDIERALEDMRENNLSYRAAAKKHKISFTVLFRYNTREEVKKVGGQTVFSAEEENFFVENINTCAEWGYPMKRYELQLLVKTYLDENGVKCKKFKNNMPGIDFTAGFLKRHKDEISEKYARDIIGRGRPEKLSQTLKTFYNKLELTLNYVPTANIINIIEFGLSEDPSLGIGFFHNRETKYPDYSTNNYVSLVMAATADGTLLSPYIVYKAQNVPDFWESDSPFGNLYNKTSSGWMDIITFEDWVTKVIMPYVDNLEGNTYILADNLSCHFSSDCIANCKMNEISFIFLPNNSADLTSPLHYAFFDTINVAWQDIINVWKETEGQEHESVPQSLFPKFLNILFDKIKNDVETNVLSGFKETGISPINTDRVLDKLRSYKKITCNDISKDKYKITNRKMIRRKQKEKVEGKPTCFYEKDSFPIKFECFLDDESIHSDESNEQFQIDVFAPKYRSKQEKSEQENTDISEDNTVKLESDIEAKELAMIGDNNSYTKQSESIEHTANYEIDIGNVNESVKFYEEGENSTNSCYLEPIDHSSVSFMCILCQQEKKVKDDTWITCTYCDNTICTHCSKKYNISHEFICKNCFRYDKKEEEDSAYIIFVE